MFKNEDHRETITYEIIKKDLIKRYNYRFNWGVVSIVLSILAAFGFIKLLQLFKDDLQNNNSQNAFSIFFFAFLAICILAEISFVAFMMINICNVKKINFQFFLTGLCKKNCTNHTTLIG